MVRMMYWPSELVRAWNSEFVPVFVALTVAFGTTPPEESRTTPVNDAVPLWPNAVSVEQSSRITSNCSLKLIVSPLKRLLRSRVPDGSRNHPLRLRLFRKVVDGHNFSVGTLRRTRVAVVPCGSIVTKDDLVGPGTPVILAHPGADSKRRRPNAIRD